MIQLIIGHTTNDSVKIWVKGINTASSAIVTLAGHAEVITVPLVESEYRTGVAQFTGLESDTHYDCQAVFDDGNVASGSFTTFPQTAGSFSFLLGSCHFSQGKDRHSPEFVRINEIAAQDKVRFMMSAGDQIYIDTLIHPFWVKGRDNYKDRYEETWYSVPLRQLYANLPQYMIIDDHEIYNDFNHNELTSRQQDLFNWATDTYRIFQHKHNPGDESYFDYTFECANACFFVMDARTRRKGDSMIDEEQMKRFNEWLSINGPSEKVKFIVSSVPLFTQTDSSAKKDDGVALHIKTNATRY